MPTDERDEDDLWGEKPRAPANTNARKPPGYELPQIIAEGILRRSRKADVITFRLRLLRLIELTFLVTLPAEGKTKAPVYVRMWIDPSRQDKPGSIVVED